jgi:tetratricopeptide (TPR) repeat protein
MMPLDARARADAVMELHEAGELEEALRAVRTLLTDLDGVDLDDPVLRESLFTARFEHAVLLTELGDLDAAEAAYGLAARTPADLDDPDQRHEVALAALNHGICLDAMGDHEAAVRVYAELVARFHAADDPVTADQVARARVNHAAALLAVDRAAEAVEHAAAARAGLDPRDVLSSEQHVMAARVEATALRQLARDEDALAVLEEALEHASREDEATRLQLAASAQEAVSLLLDHDRTGAAVELLDAALVAQDEERDPEVAELLAELAATRVRLAGERG